MANSIRISNGTKRIEINEDGEYIILPLGDQGFITRIIDLVDWFYSVQADLSPRGIEIDAMPSETLEQQIAKFRATANLNLEIHQKMGVQVDETFGPGTCQKLFGDIVPGIELYADFFNQISPIVEEYMQERASKVNKYSAKRIGNSK